MKPLVAIDPGREKCGLAVAITSGILHKQVVPRAEVVQTAASLAAEHDAGLIVIGNGTGSEKLAGELREVIALPISVVEEAFTSQRARARFFEDNPPKGLRRLVPRGLLSPDRPYDDYVAVILAEDYFLRQQA